MSAKSENPQAALTDEIMREKIQEENARAAKNFLIEYDALMLRLMTFVKASGNGQPQEPLNYCRNLILQYGFSKLGEEIKIIHS